MMQQKPSRKTIKTTSLSTLDDISDDISIEFATNVDFAKAYADLSDRVLRALKRNRTSVSLTDRRVLDEPEPKRRKKTIAKTDDFFAEAHSSVFSKKKPLFMTTKMSGFDSMCDVSKKIDDVYSLYDSVKPVVSNEFGLWMKDVVGKYERALKHLNFSTYCDMVSKQSTSMKQTSTLPMLSILVQKASVCVDVYDVFVRSCLDQLSNALIPDPVRAVMSKMNVERVDRYLFETILKSQVKGQPMVCEQVAMHLYPGFVEHRQKNILFASEYLKKRELGSDYVADSDAYESFKTPTITKLHLAGTSGTGKSLMGCTIADMFGVSQKQKTYVRIPLSLYSDKTNTQLMGGGKGLTGYGDGTDLASKLKEALIYHDPRTRYDVEHLIYSNVVILCYLLDKSLFTEKVRSKWNAYSSSIKRPSEDDFFDFYKKLKHDVAVYDADGTGNKDKTAVMNRFFDFFSNNADVLKMGKIDVKTGLPISILPASYYTRDLKSELKLPQHCTEYELGVSFVKHVIKSSTCWTALIATDNDEYAVSIDAFDRMEDEDGNGRSKSDGNSSSSSWRGSTKGGDRAKKQSSSTRGVFKKTASVSNNEAEGKVTENPHAWTKGSMVIPDLGDYNCTLYPSRIVLHLDELDKMNKAGLTVLEHFLETGQATSSHGETFVLPPSTHLIIVFTSNFGDAEIESSFVSEKINDIVKNRKKTQTIEEEDGDAISSSSEDECENVRLEDVIDDDGDLTLSELDEKTYRRYRSFLEERNERYVECVKRSMVDRKITACYIGRLGYIIPYGPVPAKIMKSVCMDYLTKPFRGSSKGLVRTVELFEDEKDHDRTLSCFSEHERLESKLLFDVVFIFNVASCITWLISVSDLLDVSKECHNMDVKDPHVGFRSTQNSKTNAKTYGVDKFYENLEFFLWECLQPFIKHAFKRENDGETAVSFVRRFFDASMRINALFFSTMHEKSKDFLSLSDFLKFAKSDLAIVREQLRCMTNYFSDDRRYYDSLDDKNKTTTTTTTTDCLEKKRNVCSDFSVAIGAVKINLEKCETFDRTKKEGFPVKCVPKVLMCVFYDVFYDRFYFKNVQKTAFGSKKNIRLACSSVVVAKQYNDMISHRNVHGDGEDLRQIVTMDGETYRQSTNTGLRGVKNDLNQNVIKYVQDTINDPRMTFAEDRHGDSTNAASEGKRKQYKTMDEHALFENMSKANVALFGVVYRNDANSFSREELELIDDDATVWDVPLKYQCHRMFVNLNSMLGSTSPVCVK